MGECVIFAHAFKIRTLLFTAICLTMLPSSRADWKVVMAETGFSGLKASKHVINTITGITLSACYHRCLTELGCMSFFYNKDSQTCQLVSMVFRSDGASGLTGNPGYEYYRVNSGACSSESGYMLNRMLGVCFKLIKLFPSPTNTFETLRRICRDNSDGRMMLVNNMEKQTLVAETTWSFEKAAVIIGLTRYPTSPLTWIWENNRTLTWNKWSPNLPTQGPTDLCVRMDPLDSSPFSWVDGYCNRTVSAYEYVACELH